MVETAIQRHVSTSHIRQLDAARDILAVADLLEEAFRDELDWQGQRAIREMRLMGGWGGVLAWADSWAFPDTGLGQGFVWIQAAQVVGHLSLRRMEAYGWGWVIGNVAVRQAQRGKGIARALMDKAIEYIRQQGGKRISLLVRANNIPAVRLYNGLRFHQLGTMAFWQRPAEARRAPIGQLPLPAGVSLRQARASDQRPVYDLARASQASELDLAEAVRYSDFFVGWDRRLADWLMGRQQVCLVAQAGKELAGAVLLDAPRAPREGRLRVWTAPGYCGQLEAALLNAALSAVRPPVNSLVSAFPARQVQVSTALAQFGFLPVKILALLRLELF